jgi:HAE1 family hydrophobic/amphiphilic exporter-1
MLALVVFGGLSLMLLHTDEFPEVNPPVISIAVPYPGAAPEGVEREVIDPMEEAFAGITGVDEIHSTSMDSFASRALNSAFATAEFSTFAICFAACFFENLRSASASFTSSPRI